MDKLRLGLGFIGGLAIVFCILWLGTAYKLNVFRAEIKTKEKQLSTLQTPETKSIEIELGEKYEATSTGGIVVPVEIIKPVDSEGVVYYFLQNGKRLTHYELTHFYRKLSKNPTPQPPK